MKILFYEVTKHFSPNFEFTGSKTIFAKIKSPFLAQKLEDKKICQNPFQAIIRLSREREKKGGMDHQAIGVGRVKP